MDNVITGIQIQVGLDSGKFESAGVRLKASAKQITESLNGISGVKADQKLQAVEQAVAKMGGVANLSAPQVARLRTEIEKLAAAGAKIPKTLELPKINTSGLDKAFSGLGSSQLSGLTGPLGSIGSALSAVGPAGLVAAAGIGAVAAAVSSAISSAVEYGSQVTDLAEKTGFSTNAVQELGYAVRQSGGDFEQVAKSAGVMERQIAAGASVFKTLGLDVAQLRQLKPEEAFLQVAEAIRKLDDPYKQAQAAAQAFGKAGIDMLPAIRSGLTELSAEAHEFGQVLNGEAVKAGDNFGDAMERASKAWTVLKATIGGKIIGTLQLDVVLNRLTQGISGGGLSGFGSGAIMAAANAADKEAQRNEAAAMAKAGDRSFGGIGAGPGEIKLPGLEAQVALLSKVGLESQKAKKDLAEFEAAARQADQELKALAQGLAQHFDEVAKARAKRENRADSQDALLGGNAAAQFESEKIQAAIIDVGGVSELSAKQVQFLAEKFFELSKAGVDIPQDLGAISAQADKLNFDEATNSMAEAEDAAIELMKTLAAMGQGPFAGLSGDAIDTLFGRIPEQVDQATEATLQWEDAAMGVADVFAGMGGTLGALGNAIGGLASATSRLKEMGGAGGIKAALKTKKGQQLAIGAAGDAVEGVGNSLKDKHPVLGNTLSGVGKGAKIGSIAGPWGAAVGAVVGGVLGFLKGKKIAAENKKAGEALGKDFGKAMAAKAGISLDELQKQIVAKAKETGKSIEEVAKEMKTQFAKDQFSEIRGKQQAAAGQIQSGLGGFGAIKGAADAQGRIFGAQFAAVVQSEGFDVALAMFKDTFSQLPEDIKANIPKEIQNLFKFGENEQFASAVDGISQMAEGFKGLAALTGISSDLMKDYGQVAQASFDQAKAGAIEAGATEEEAQKAAIQATVPLLSQMKSASVQSGVALDPASQGLIDQAEAAGIHINVDPLIEVADTLKQMLDLQRQLAGLPPLAPKVDTTQLDGAAKAGEKAGKDLGDGIARGSAESSAAAKDAIDGDALKAKMAELGKEGGAAMGEGIAAGVAGIGLAAGDATTGVGDLGDQGQETSKTLQDGLSLASARMDELTAKARAAAEAIKGIPPPPGGGGSTTTTGPGFATGGIGRFSTSGTHAVLHGVEAIIPLNRKRDALKVIEDAARIRPQLFSEALGRIVEPVSTSVPSFASGGFTGVSASAGGGSTGVFGGGGGVTISASIPITVNVEALGDLSGVGGQVASAIDAEVPVIMDALARTIRREFAIQ